MTFNRIAFISIFVIAVVVETRHVHPRSEQWIDVTGDRAVNVNNEHSTAKTEVVDIKPQKISPLSSILFFKSYDPCDDGFELDYLGICREVWF